MIGPVHPPQPVSRDVPEQSAPLPPVSLGQMDGVLVLDKPKGLSSAACIARIKRRFGQKKIGHAGTLDPMATGVLLVLLGQGTKLSGYLLEHGEKIYSGVIRLGIVTDTWDAEGATLERRPVLGVDQARVDAAMAALTGTYEQEVPAYSAAKHRGKPLYALARKGVDVPVKKKVVTVSRGEAELVGLERIRFRVHCSSGTYIRSLAHSLGNRLGCGGMLEELVREYSHPFGIEQACPLEDALAEPEAFPSRVRGLAEALPGWSRIRLLPEDEGRIRNGNKLPYAGYPLEDLPFVPGMRALLLDGNDTALALAESVLDGREEAWAVARGLWNPNA